MTESKGYITVYLIRHAETVDAAESISQRDSAPLSEKGKAQAKGLAEHFPVRACDMVITSSFERSKETAKFLAEKISAGETIEMPEVGEHQWGADFQGISWDSDEYEVYRDRMYKALESDQPMEGVESIAELSARAGKVLDFLEGNTNKTIALVSHGTLLKTMLLQMIFGRDAGLPLHRRMSNHLIFKNAGYIRCIYNHDTNAWRAYIDRS